MVGQDVHVFVPPRKRQQTKKLNNLSLNYVDHISNIQNQKCDNTFIKRDLSNNELSSPIEQLELNLSADVLKDEIEENELDNFESISQSLKEYQKNDGSGNTQTPSSCYSETSLERRSHECLTTPATRSSSKKRVNIQTNNDHYIKDKQSPSLQMNYDDTSILNLNNDDCNNDIDKTNSLDIYPRKKSDNYLTMTGTIKRGKKKGQSLDVQFNISREELEKINASALATVEQIKQNKKNCCLCTLNNGVHILLLSILTLPFVVLICSLYSFYIGTLTWYSIFTYFSEEKTCLHKFFMSPLLIISYPFVIIICTFGLGIYGGFIQLSMSFTNWLNEICDIEKGFYGWLCGFLHLSDCSPYEVVILTDFQIPENPVHSSTEELSL